MLKKLALHNISHCKCSSFQFSTPPRCSRSPRAVSPFYRNTSPITVATPLEECAEIPLAEKLDSLRTYFAQPITPDIFSRVVGRPIVECYGDLNGRTIFGELAEFRDFLMKKGQVLGRPLNKSDLEKQACLDSLRKTSLKGVKLKHFEYYFSQEGSRWNNFIHCLFNDDGTYNEANAAELFNKIDQKDMPFLQTKGLIVVSDFVTTQTLAIYNDEGHDYYALSGENQILRSLLKEQVPNLLARPSTAFLEDKLNPIFESLNKLKHNLHLLKDDEKAKLIAFLRHSWNYIEAEKKNSQFISNMIGLELVETHDGVKLQNFDDVQTYLEKSIMFNSAHEFLYEKFTSDNWINEVNKIYRAFIAGKMWCAEKAIDHQLSKYKKQINYDKIEAFTLGSLLRSCKHQEKSSIKVCRHCRQLGNIEYLIDILKIDFKTRRTPLKSPQKRSRRYVFGDISNTVRNIVFPEQ